MDPLVASIIETTGLGVFIWYSLQGLKAKLTSLEGVISAQKQTIEVMDKRIEETEKIGGIYRNLLSNLPADIDNYKTFISKTRDDVIVELKNQNDDTAKKLSDAQRQIQNSGTSEEQINRYLRALKNLLSKGKSKSGIQKELGLKAIVEFKDENVENAIPIILSSPTVEDFLQKFGYRVEISEIPDVFKTLFNEKIMPDGSEILTAFGTQSVSDGWLAMANDRIWMNAERLGVLKDEFSFVKTIA